MGEPWCSQNICKSEKNEWWLLSVWKQDLRKGHHARAPTEMIASEQVLKRVGRQEIQCPRATQQEKLKTSTMWVISHTGRGCQNITMKNVGHHTKQRQTQVPPDKSLCRPLSHHKYFIASTCSSHKLFGCPLGLLQSGLSLTEATQWVGSATCPYGQKSHRWTVQIIVTKSVSLNSH